MPQKKAASKIVNVNEDIGVNKTEKRKSHTHPRPEVLALPLLHRRIRLEVVEVLEVEPLVFAVQLYRPFFTTGNDGVDIFVDDQTALISKN